MGLLEQEIKEIRKMAKEALSGELTAERAAIQIGFFNQTSKRVSQMIQIAALEAKGRDGRRAYSNMVRANVIGDGTAIFIDSSDQEMVVCPEQGGKCICREECLDYSGMSQNIDDCQKCEQFEKTRRGCLPKAG